MPWRLVKLEHGPTETYPEGSVCRTYLLRLPLDGEGKIDREMHARHPERATARRFWPNEKDRYGYVVKRSRLWVLTCEQGETDMASFADSAIAIGRILEICETDAGAIPFRVSAIRHG